MTQRCHCFGGKVLEIGSSSKIRTSSSSGISSCQIRKSWDGIDGHLWMTWDANFARALGFSPAPILDLSAMCNGVPGYGTGQGQRVLFRQSQVSDTSCSSSMVGIGLKKGGQPSDGLCMCGMMCLHLTYTDLTLGILGAHLPIVWHSKSCF